VTKPRKPCHPPVDHSRQLPRLRRVEGQVRGLQQMIADQRYCIDVINQIEAITAALRRIESDMLSEHIAALSRTAMSEAFSPGDSRAMIEEIAALLKRR